MNWIKTLLSILTFTLIFSYSIAQSSRKPSILIFAGMGNQTPASPYKQWVHQFYNDILTDHLKSFADVTVSEDLTLLNNKTLENYDLIINNSFLREPTADQFAAFYQFVESGKSYFALHAGLVSFVNSDKYLKMMGGRFIGHDDVKTFLVNPYDSWYGWEVESHSKKHDIVKDISDFKIVDELYLAQFNTTDLEVIARAELHPIMWMRPWGKGRILCLTLGHGDFSQRNEGFRQLFVNGVKWLIANNQ